jgi:hypothetical protein
VTYSADGAYKVEPDCTILIKTNYFQSGKLSGSNTFSGVIVNGGAKVTVILTGPGSVPAAQQIFEAVQ